jgi:DNA (cytosine-5)-methyltransferase 1
MSAAPTCIDAFCGAGGLSLGLTEAGFDVAAAFDLDGPSVDTYALNQGEHVFRADAREVDWDRLVAASGADTVDLLAGGPPCQGFSKQRRGAHLGDERNALVLEFLRLVEEGEPRAFLLENVPQLAQVRGSHLVDHFHALSNYRLSGQFYVAADYGVAQVRERFVMVGLRADVEGPFASPSPTTPQEEWPTVGESIGDLPEPPADYTEHSEFFNHQAARVRQPNIERFSHVPEGGGWRDIPFDLRLKCHQVVDTSKGGWPDVYGRLRWDGQCPTITGGFDSFTRGRYGHPHSDRPLTPREAARLQGFPDWYRFLGNRHDVRHQIGNAVPVTLAAAIGGAIDAALLGESPAAAVAEPVLF